MIRLRFYVVDLGPPPSESLQYIFAIFAIFLADDKAKKGPLRFWEYSNTYVRTTVTLCAPCPGACMIRSGTRPRIIIDECRKDEGSGSKQHAKNVIPNTNFSLGKGDGMVAMLKNCLVSREFKQFHLNTE